MKNISFVILVAGMALALVSCEKEKHFLEEETYRKQVQEQFKKRKVEVRRRNSALFSVFENDGLSVAQREALEFLYACMPLCDLADYTGEFFLRQVDAAFRAREYFPWGKTIPDDIFRHFVLVYRVNNEYLDTARTAFFEELKERIENLSMYEAALEVNHWCHEKVAYRGADARTSAPLALVKTSWGHCGEESTFTTAALRAVGIPARQCYTPRWVHTDDNHAWVEVWVDGQALDEWGGGVLFLTSGDKASTAAGASAFNGLPQNTSWGVDARRDLLQAVTGALQIDFNNNFPLTLYLSRNGGVLYSAAGYRIGAGEEILKIIRQENKVKTISL
jgi:hypothetical protein